MWILEKQTFVGECQREVKFGSVPPSDAAIEFPFKWKYLPFLYTSRRRPERFILRQSFSYFFSAFIHLQLLLLFEVDYQRILQGIRCDVKSVAV